MVSIWILTLITLVAVVGYIASILTFSQRCPLLCPSDNVPQDVPLISIVVPARNEALHIEQCVSSLLAQRYPNIEVIAVDDASTDATPAILSRLAASDPRLRIVQNQRLPAGWTGKCHAVYQGTRHAQGTWLLFVDADVTLHPDALIAAYQAAQKYGATMLSLWARQELKTFWERVVQPVIISMNQAADLLQQINASFSSTVASANGQFILVERAAYEQVGGHASVRDAVLEDHMLASQFKQAGFRTFMLDGSPMLSTRMYTSLESIWEGWSKNNFLSLGRSLSVASGVVLAIYFMTISPFVLTTLTLIGLPWEEQLITPLLINGLATIMLLATRHRTRARFETPPSYYLLHWLGGLMFAGIVMNSAYRYTRRRGVTWKGRRYGDIGQPL